MARTWVSRVVFTPAAVVGFVPTDLGATLKLWLDASDGSTITLSSGKVSTWADKSGSGSGFDATQATPTERPIVASAYQNSLDAIAFGTILIGQPASLLLPSFAALTAGTMVIVGQKTADDDGKALFQFGSSGSNSHHPFTDTNIYDDFGSTARKTVGNPSPSLASWFLFSIRSNASDWEFYVNGTSLFSTGTNTVGFGTTPIIGTNITGAGSFSLEGYIGEITLADSALSTLNRQKLEGYVAWKWGIQSVLPGGHPYAAAPP